MNILHVVLLVVVALSTNISAAQQIQHDDTTENTTPITEPQANAVTGLISPESVGSGVSAADPLAVLLGLLLVVVLIFIVAWLLRRVGGVSMLGSQTMKVVAGLSVGTREKVLLIDVGGKQVLIGVAPGRVSQLHYFDEPVIESSGVPVSEFSTKFKQLMQQGLNKQATTKESADSKRA